MYMYRRCGEPTVALFFVGQDLMLVAPFPVHTKSCNCLENEGSTLLEHVVKYE